MKSLKNLSKRGIALLLSLMMLFSMVPVNALAEESPEPVPDEAVTTDLPEGAVEVDPAVLVEYYQTEYNTDVEEEGLAIEDLFTYVSNAYLTDEETGEVRTPASLTFTGEGVEEKTFDYLDVAFPQDDAELETVDLAQDAITYQEKPVTVYFLEKDVLSEEEMQQKIDELFAALAEETTEPTEEPEEAPEQDEEPAPEEAPEQDEEPAEDENGLADMPEASTFSSDNGISTLAIGGSVTITMHGGETRRITGTEADYSHSWSSSDTNVVTVDAVTDNGSNTNVATLTAKGTGTATITHTYQSNYWWSSSQTETMTVTVTKDAVAVPSGSNRVYVYIKFAGDATQWTGWSVNKDGWFTVGYVDVPGLSAASGDRWINASGTINLLKTGLVRHSSSASLDFDLSLVEWAGTNGNKDTVTWTANGKSESVDIGLHTADGASDFDDGSKTWHLDGCVRNAGVFQFETNGGTDVSAIMGRYNATVSDRTMPTTTRTGYTFAGWYENEVLSGDAVEQLSETFPNGAKTYYAKWTPNTDTAYKVEHYKETSDGNYELAETENLTGTTGTTATATAKSYDGFFENTTHAERVASGMIAANGSLVLKLYYAKKYEVSVTAKSVDTTYDGTEKTASGFVGETAQGIPVTANEQTYYVTGLTSEAKGTNVADSVSSITITGTEVVKDAAGNVVTDQFIVTKNPGHLTISKRPVTLTSADLNKEYDGTALTNGETALAVETGWVSGQGATYSFTGSQTLVGNSANAFSYKLNANTDANNYAITKSEGTLTVNNRTAKYQVTVVANSTEATYDGTEKTASGFENETAQGIPVTANGQTYYVTGLTSRATGTNVADSKTTIPVEGTAIVKDSSGNVVTKQFEVSSTKGSLTINKRAVTLTSADLNKEYDGTALTNGETALATETGWADGEGATYSFTGSQTLVGNSANAFSYKLNVGTDANNYAIIKSEGTLTVNNREAKYQVTVVANSTQATYDGIEKTASGFAGETDDGIRVTANGQVYYVTGLTSSAAGTNVVDSQTTIPVEGTAIVKDSSGNVVTDQFNVTATPGHLTISKRGVTLTSADLNKEYDGTALTNGETALATETGWADGEGATYTFTGSQTLAGSSANAFSYTLNANTTATNYEISKTEGTLTVNDRTRKYEVSVTAKSVDTTYDGTEKTASGFDGETAQGIPVTADGRTYYVTGLTSEAKGTNVADSVSSITITGTEVVKDAAGNVVTDQFIVTKNPGSLTINPATLTIVTESDSRAYNGEALTANGTIDGFVNGETANFVVTGNQTNEGTSKNTYSLTWDGTAKESNYTINETLGTLTVNPQTVTVNYVTDDEIPVKLGGFSYTLTHGNTYDHSKGDVNAVPEEGDNNTKSPAQITNDGKHYVYDPVQAETVTGTVGAQAVTVTVIYSLDAIGGTDPEGEDPNDPTKKPDGIADKYQVTVQYVSADPRKGTVTASDKVFTLKDDQENYVTNGTITPGTEGVVVARKSGFAFDGWKMEDAVANPDDALVVKGGETYIYTAYWDTDELDDPTIPENPPVEPDDPENPPKGDGTPDKYQVTVTFKAEGGSFNGKTEVSTVVTLYKEDNGEKVPATAADGGKGYLTKEQIPTAKASESYTGNGTWDTNPSITTPIKEDVTYVIKFTKYTPVTPPSGGGDTPVDPNPPTTRYTVNWEDGDGNIIKTTTTTSTDIPKSLYPADPEKEDVSFLGWGEPDIVGNVITIIAEWDEEIGGNDVPLVVAPGLDSENHYAYIIGYGDGTVRPTRNITRAEVATIFYRLMTDDFRAEAWSQTNDFADVNSGDWFNNAVSTSAEAGLLMGYGDGTFQGKRNITRAEFAAIAARFIPNIAVTVESYPDTVGHWAEEEIRIVTEAGWFQGDNGMFRPNDLITRAEAMTVVNRMLNRVPHAEDLLEGEMTTYPDNQPGAWYYAAVQEATNSHDYEMGERDGQTVETWTNMKPNRDWAALEKEWSEANSGSNGTEVA